MSDDLTEDLTPGGVEPPPPPAPPARPGPPAEDSTPSFVRNTVVMSAGIAISRLTGFLRLAGDGLRDRHHRESRLADAYNVANTTPNIVYELALGGILTSVFVPVFVEWMRGARARRGLGRRRRRCSRSRSCAVAAIALLGILAGAVDHRPVHHRRPRRPQREAERRARHVLPTLVHAADRLLRDRAPSRPAC